MNISIKFTTSNNNSRRKGASKISFLAFVIIFSLAIFTTATLALTVNDIANYLQSIFQFSSNTTASTGSILNDFYNSIASMAYGISKDIGYGGGTTWQPPPPAPVTLPPGPILPPGEPVTCQQGNQCGTFPNCYPCPPACTPNCAGRVCGLDPICGTSCGNCYGGWTCNNGQCSPPSQQCSSAKGACRYQRNCYFGETQSTLGCPLGAICCMPGSACTNECTQGAQECTSSIGYRICRQGTDGCYHWISASCPSSQTCSNGQCSQGTVSQCTSGGGYCRDSSGVTFPNGCFGSDTLIQYTCTSNDAKGQCVSNSVSCASQCQGGGICSNGACSCNTAACTPSNANVNCASYNSADRCMVGACVNSACKAVPNPGQSCNGGKGTCDNTGTCVATTIVCPYQCIPHAIDCSGSVVSGYTCTSGVCCRTTTANCPNGYVNDATCGGNCNQATQDCKLTDTTNNCYQCVAKTKIKLTCYQECLSEIIPIGIQYLGSCGQPSNLMESKASNQDVSDCPDDCYCFLPFVFSITTPQVGQSFTTTIQALASSTLSIFIGDPVPNGIRVDDGKEITFTPVKSGTIVIDSFLFGDNFPNHFQLVIDKITVS